MKRCLIYSLTRGHWWAALTCTSSDSIDRNGLFILKRWLGFDLNEPLVHRPLDASVGYKSFIFSSVDYIDIFPFYKYICCRPFIRLTRKGGRFSLLFFYFQWKKDENMIRSVSVPCWCTGKHTTLKKKSGIELQVPPGGLWNRQVPPVGLAGNNWTSEDGRMMEKGKKNGKCHRVPLRWWWRRCDAARQFLTRPRRGALRPIHSRPVDIFLMFLTFSDATDDVSSGWKKKAHKKSDPPAARLWRRQTAAPIQTDNFFDFHFFEGGPRLGLPVHSFIVEFVSLWNVILVVQLICFEIYSNLCKWMQFFVGKIRKLIFKKIPKIWNFIFNFIFTILNIFLKNFIPLKIIF